MKRFQFLSSVAVILYCVFIISLGSVWFQVDIYKYSLVMLANLVCYYAITAWNKLPDENDHNYDDPNNVVGYHWCAKVSWEMVSIMALSCFLLGIMEGVLGSIVTVSVCLSVMWLASAHIINMGVEKGFPIFWLCCAGAAFLWMLTVINQNISGHEGAVMSFGISAIVISVITLIMGGVCYVLPEIQEYLHNIRCTGENTGL